MRFIRVFDQVSLADVALVGGKNASIGQMIRELSSVGVRVPSGFAITAEAYWEYVEANDLKKVIEKELGAHTTGTLSGKKIRDAFIAGTIPDSLRNEIVEAYKGLSSYYNTENLSVAVRSSATAEDLPHASFAGQQETFLNVSGIDKLLESCKHSLASLFTDRALFYRQEQGFNHLQVALSIGVQKMVRSDRASSGVLFTLDPQTGFQDVVAIESSFGLGESIVKGLVVPDEFHVFKTTLAEGYKPIVKKNMGTKQIKIIFGEIQQGATIEVPIPNNEQNTFSLHDEEVLELSKIAVAIEKHYSEKKGQWMPMDIEWAKDGIDEKLYIVQARPETVHSAKKKDIEIVQYQFIDTTKDRTPIAKGTSIGMAIVSGTARVITSIKDIDLVQEGDILVTYMSDPDWVPIMKKVAAIITERGGRTCHAAIVSRELGVPAIVGVPDAVKTIQNGATITVDCSHGSVGFLYEGSIPFKKVTEQINDIPQAPVSVMLNIADPTSAYRQSFLPVDGVGLARIEFIIAHIIGVHPMALLDINQIKNNEIKTKIKQKICGYSDGKTFFVDQLSYGIGIIAAAFFPRPVLVRFSDFKTNEYRALLGGEQFEPVEENPMLGFRGAARYCSAKYNSVFELECTAIKKVRNSMGLKNVQAMIPFVRTVQEAQQVHDLLQSYDLVSGHDGLKIIMMAEIPSNALCAPEFITLFDGFSIGSNDLTQLVLGCDRDSELVSHLFDERDPAVVAACNMIISAAKKVGKYSGICGQGPSDYPEFARQLIKMGIDSISLNPDVVLSFLRNNSL